MPDRPYDKTCPKCAANGEAIKATTGRPDVILVDLRCTQCAHTWTVTLTSRSNS